MPMRFFMPGYTFMNLLTHGKKAPVLAGAYMGGHAFSNISFPTPQMGQTQSSGISSNLVPGAIPLSGSPAAGSYTYPHAVQIYLSINPTPFKLVPSFSILLPLFKKE